MLRRVFLLSFVFVLAVAAHALADIVAASGDASIAHDTAAQTWTLAAGGATLIVALDAKRDFELLSLTSPSRQEWLPRSAASATITVNGAAVPFGSRGAGFDYQSATASVVSGRLELAAAFDYRAANLRVTRHIAVADASPTFEFWTTFQSLTSRTSTVSNIAAIELTIPAGQVHWLTGLQGDSADADVSTAFTLQQQTLGATDALSLGADGRSSSQTVPWFAVDGSSDEFYGALAWSGAWSLSIRRAAGLHVTFGLPPMGTVVGEIPVEGPHVLVGAAAGGLENAAAGLRAFVLNGLRNGNPVAPLVTYNTWFAYGTNIDEPSMRSEMASAAEVGAELFVIDAGWYTGAGASGPFDFDAGLGSWEVDPERFPNGLQPLRDYAHSLGMKFGLWVEPERVNLSTIGGGGADESWLATADGDYGSDHAAQICLADAAARQWILARLESLIDAVQPDYLKWDNNFWINCDRSGHGHGATDGNFRHVAGLYEILSTLRQDYPSLLIENVSGGGNRLDYGMLRFTDVAWMDDRTAPSINVRHNLEGLSAAFPPAYLLSFVTDHVGEPLHDAPDLPLYVRSRMAGALGLCYRAADLSEADLASLAAQIDVYKSLRATLSVASDTLLTAQAAPSDPPPWDALQAASPDGGSLVVYAYQTDQDVDSTSIKPTGLDPAATYAVTSVDTGVLGTATGADLMANGIDVVASRATSAHIITLVRQ